MKKKYRLPLITTETGDSEEYWEEYGKHIVTYRIIPDDEFDEPTDVPQVQGVPSTIDPRFPIPPKL